MLNGCIVTLDAMGCQKSIIKQIRDQEADYVVTVKGNHPQLQRHVKGAFAAADALDFLTSVRDTAKRMMLNTDGLRNANVGC